MESIEERERVQLKRKFAEFVEGVQDLVANHGRNMIALEFKEPESDKKIVFQSTHRNPIMAHKQGLNAVQTQIQACRPLIMPQCTNSYPPFL